jgi:sulfur relay (sulfurtransferase) DsrC/TusE family protein
VNQYHYVRIDESCYLLNYNDWDNTPVVKIEIPDEIVYIKNNVVENIKFPIDLFDFSIFQE